jgi:hypothetical protein
VNKGEDKNDTHKPSVVSSAEAITFLMKESGRTGAATFKAIAATSKCDPKQLMEEVAPHHFIKPVVTQGHIGEVHRLRRRDDPAVPMACF